MFSLRVLFVVALIAGFTNVAEAAFCSSAPDPGERTNDFAIADSDMKLVRKISNGAHYRAGPENARFDVVHVYGSAYEMGFAQGKLMKVSMTQFVLGTWEWLISGALDEAEDKLPKWAQALIVDKGLEKALDWTAKVTEPYTPKEYFEEIQGLADGSGLSYELLLRVNMMPELTKASCSFFGAWGSATKANGHTYQLRALDYVTDAAPFTDHPQITIYHPSAEGSIAHASVAWPGTVGLLTGFSAAQLGISEIGVSFADDSFGQGTDNTPPEKVRGQPWMSVLKDVAQYSNGLDAALSTIENANRTCNLIIGVGDGEASMVNGVQYSGYVANPYNDQNLIPVNDTWHKPIDNVVYNGMDWDCPTYTQKLGEQLEKYHGSIDATKTIGNILPTVQTGDLHIAVYDLTDSNMFVSFCRSSTASEDEPQYAYQRQFTKLDMGSLFAMKQ